MPQRRRILVVDADDEIREAIVDQLSAVREFVVVEASTVQDVEKRATLRRERIDAVVLDETLPDGEGAEFIARLRKRSLRMPILLMTKSGTPAAPGTHDWSAEIRLVKPEAFPALL